MITFLLLLFWIQCKYIALYIFQGAVMSHTCLDSIFNTLTEAGQVLLTPYS